jgi:HlyD family secretion protein
MNIKNLVKLIIVLGLIAFFVYSMLPQPLAIDSYSVKKSDIIVTVEGEGQTRIHDIYTVSTPIDGRVTRVEIEAGDYVFAAESVIANMYPSNPAFLDRRTEIQAQADVEGAKAALALATARVKQAKTELEYNLADNKRIKQLFAKKLISETDMEKSDLHIKTLQAELETVVSNEKLMQSRLEAAKTNLLQPDNADLAIDSENSDCQICIKSPVDGMVLRILHKSESIVPVGTPLVEIGDPEDLEAKIEMLSTNAVKVKVGDKALLKNWGGDHDINAVVRTIEPSGFTKISALGIEQQRVNIILNLTDPIEKWKQLGDAFRIEAEIIIDSAENVLVVPLSALFRQNQQWSVYKIVDDVTQLQKVEIGKRNDRYAEIKNGLQENDEIVLYPGNKISDNIKISRK